MSKSKKYFRLSNQKSW